MEHNYLQNYNKTNYEYLQEAYFGKNKNILLVEKNISLILKEFKSSKNKKTIHFTTRGTDIPKYLENIEDILKKEFGFKDVAISIEYAFTSANACTYFQPLYRTIKGKVIKNSEGVRYISNNMVLCVFLGDNLFKGDFTAGEITAVLLHEIGHNFYANNNTSEMVLSEIYKAITSLGVSIFAMPIQDMIIRLTPHIKRSIDKSGLRIFVDMNNYILKSLTILLSITNALTLNIIPTVINMCVDTMEIVKDLLPKVSQMKSEKFADNFATAYGYGVETVSLNKKFSIRKGDEISNIPVINALDDISSLPNRIISLFLDEHPNSYSRMQDQIKYIESELNSINDPKMYKLAKEQLDQMKKIVKSFPTDNIINNVTKQQFGSMLINIISSTLLKDKAIHDFVGRKKGKDWNQFKSSKSILK